MYILESLTTGWTITQQASISINNTRKIQFISESLDLVAQYAIENNIFNINLKLIDAQNQQVSYQQFLPPIKQIMQQPQAQHVATVHHPLPQLQKPIKQPSPDQTTFKPIIFENTPPIQIFTHYISLLGHFSIADFQAVKTINYADFTLITGRKFYTDGGLTHKGVESGMGGYASIEVVDNKIVSEFFDGFTQTTNTRMEMVAILQVLESFSGSEMVYIGTDSLSTIDTFTRNLEKYIKNGRIRADSSIKNLDLFCRILYSLKGRSVEFCYVKAHSDDKFNKYVDVLTSMKRGGNVDFCYLQSINTVQPEKDNQMMEMDVKTIFMKNQVFSRDYYIQTQFWIDKLNNAQQHCAQYQVFKIDMEQFRNLQIPKFYYQASGGDNSGDKGGFCVVQYDKLLYLPVQFYLTSIIRAQLYGLLFILILTMPAQAICIMSDNLLPEDILIKRRISWISSSQNKQLDADLIAQIYFYSLGRQIYIVKRTQEDISLKLDSQSILNTDQHLNHDIAFETFKDSKQSKMSKQQKDQKSNTKIVSQIKK